MLKGGWDGTETILKRGNGPVEKDSCNKEKCTVSDRLKRTFGGKKEKVQG